MTTLQPRLLGELFVRTCSAMISGHRYPNAVLSLSYNPGTPDLIAIIADAKTNDIMPRSITAANVISIEFFDETESISDLMIEATVQNLCAQLDAAQSRLRQTNISKAG